MSSNIVIQLQNLGKCYHLYDKPHERLLQMLYRAKKSFYKESWVLKDVNLEIGKGESIGIIGRNGAGKSTLLQLICGTLNPTTGTALVHGRIAALLELGSGFNPEFTGRENVFLNARILGLSYEETVDRYEEIVDFSGIREFIDQPVKTYSSGMYVRLAFSIATCVEPDVLIIDEALSVGDGEFARKSFDRITELKNKGATILFCSHSMYHIEAICDRALWLDCGQMIMLDKPDKVVSAYSAAITPAEKFLSSEQAKSFASLAQASIQSGQARIERIVASSGGVFSNKLALHSCESDLKVLIEFQSDPELPSPTVAFGIETLAGMSITSSGTFLDGVEVIRSADGSASVELLLPKVPLMRGVYRVSIFLACENLIHVYDHAPNCIELEVTQPGIEQGVVYLPHKWGNVKQ